MKKILLFISILLLPFMANADSIESVDMNIVLDNDGTAHVTETWVANVYNGTEGWHPYYNLDSSKIIVTGGSIDGKAYTTVSSWDENSSMSAKAYKTGVYYAGGVEYDVVFGITEYGHHTYVINYDITNFVRGVTDADMAYWTLFPYDFSMSPDNVTIKISGPYEYPDTLDVWGFGMYGAPCYVKDGAAYMTSDGRISSSEYLTILIKYPQGVFNTNVKEDNSFDYYLNMANEGATIYVDDNYNNEPSFFEEIISTIVTIFFMIIPIGIIVSAVKKSEKYDYGKDGKGLGEVPNFRDIPCDKDIFYAYWISDTYDGLAKKQTDFLGAVLLKWIHDGNVVVQETEIKKLLKTTTETVIVFDHEPATANEKEKELYNYMKEASKDGKLESNEFKVWCKNHYNKIFDWFKDTVKYERDLLVNKNLINKKIPEKGLIKAPVYEITPTVIDEAKKLKGLKQFLKEFTRIEEKKPIEVKLWNEYLMYAQIFGIAEEVMSKFKKLYPEIIEEMKEYNCNYNTFYFANSISNTGVKAASAARSAAQSYSSGGGGFSSGGGGGGSFGGGGGGGGFR